MKRSKKGAVFLPSVILCQVGGHCLLGFVMFPPVEWSGIWKSHPGHTGCRLFLHIVELRLEKGGWVPSVSPWPDIDRTCASLEKRESTDEMKPVPRPAFSWSSRNCGNLVKLLGSYIYFFPFQKLENR